VTTGSGREFGRERRMSEPPGSVVDRLLVEFDIEASLLTRTTAMEALA
jgi:hypothetical protein